MPVFQKKPAYLAVGEGINEAVEESKRAVEPCDLIFRWSNWYVRDDMKGRSGKTVQRDVEKTL